MLVKMATAKCTMGETQSISRYFPFNTDLLQGIFHSCCFFLTDVKLSYSPLPDLDKFARMLIICLHFLRTSFEESLC